MVVPENPKRGIVMDTDWVTAASMVLLFAVCVLLGAGAVWRLLHGKVHLVAVSWPDTLAALFLVYVAIFTPARELRILCVLLALGPISKALFWGFKASVDLQYLNSLFVGWIDVVIFGAVAAYIVLWLIQKTRKIRQTSS